MHVCPNCGYCPHCGRSGPIYPRPWRTHPWGPMIPPRPIWISPSPMQRPLETITLGSSS